MWGKGIQPGTPLITVSMHGVKNHSPIPLVSLVIRSKNDMVNHMKTTIHIPNSLFEEARKVARQERTTLKALVEEGLRRIISERQRRGGFRLRKATFKGKGLQSHLADASWEKIRELSYEGRGG